ncbi:hypothetical protein BH10CHL1_BH10CHL1_37470 [soil metagenome]
MYSRNTNVSLSETPVVTKSTPNRKTKQHQPELRFCPSIFCLTDEISVQRISPQANVWVLTDTVEDQAWFTMGETPTCPHCGAVLLAANPSS